MLDTEPLHETETTRTAAAAAGNDEAAPVSVERTFDVSVTIPQGGDCKKLAQDLRESDLEDVSVKFAWPDFVCLTFRRSGRNVDTIVNDALEDVRRFHGRAQCRAVNFH